MTSCAECLSALSSSRLTDIGPGSAVAFHCSSCPTCTRVADEVRYAEYRLAASLNEQQPGFRSEEVAVNALEGSELRRRRHIARWVRGGLAVIAMAVFGAFMETRVGDNSRARRNLVTETITLRCITAKQAADLVTPYLRASGSVVYRADDLHAVTIRANGEEFIMAKMVLDNIDKDGACAVLPGSAPVAPTAAGTPGKD